MLSERAVVECIYDGFEHVFFCLFHHLSFLSVSPTQIALVAQDWRSAKTGQSALVILLEMWAEQEELRGRMSFIRDKTLMFDDFFFSINLLLFFFFSLLSSVPFPPVDSKGVIDPRKPLGHSNEDKLRDTVSAGVATRRILPLDPRSFAPSAVDAPGSAMVKFEATQGLIHTARGDGTCNTATALGFATVAIYYLHALAISLAYSGSLTGRVSGATTSRWSAADAQTKGVPKATLHKALTADLRVLSIDN
jgi:hypothetical protein